MKRKVTGWLGRGLKPNEALYRANFYSMLSEWRLFDVKTRHGEEKDWQKFDWPPRRVTITVEVEE